MMLCIYQSFDLLKASHKHGSKQSLKIIAKFVLLPRDSNRLRKRAYAGCAPPNEATMQKTHIVSESCSLRHPPNRDEFWTSWLGYGNILLVHNPQASRMMTELGHYWFSCIELARNALHLLVVMVEFTIWTRLQRPRCAVTPTPQTATTLLRTSLCRLNGLRARRKKNRQFVLA